MYGPRVPGASSFVWRPAGDKARKGSLLNWEDEPPRVMVRREGLEGPRVSQPPVHRFALKPSVGTWLAPAPKKPSAAAAPPAASASAASAPAPGPEINGYPPSGLVVWWFDGLGVEFLVFIVLSWAGRLSSICKAGHSSRFLGEGRPCSCRETPPPQQSFVKHYRGHSICPKEGVKRQCIDVYICSRFPWPPPPPPPQ